MTATNKNKVYVLTQGSYSDYHIEAVFSTEDKALQQVFSKQGINIPEQKIIDKNECMMAKHELIHDLLIKREK